MEPTDVYFLAIISTRRRTVQDNNNDHNMYIYLLPSLYKSHDDGMHKRYFMRV